jgi:hypothetical protein
VEKNNVTSKASEIPGDIFVLPMEKMVNLNIYYLNLDNIKLEASPVVPIVNTQ